MKASTEVLPSVFWSTSYTYVVLVLLTTSTIGSSKSCGAYRWALIYEISEAVRKTMSCKTEDEALTIIKGTYCCRNE